MTECPFCDRLEARDFDPELSDDGWMAVFEPLNPVTPGHLLVVPWHHCESAAADPECAKYAMAHAASLVRDHRIGPANLITSIGAEATQTVLHQHLHIIPRRDGDGLQLPWSGQVRVARCRYCYCVLADSPECAGGCAHKDRGYGGCKWRSPGGSEERPVTENTTAAVTAEQQAKHEQSHREAELYDNPGARTAKGGQPVGWVVACRTAYDDSDHWVMDSMGMWLSREEAEMDKADSLLNNAFDDNEKLFVCAVVPVEDGRG